MGEVSKTNMTLEQVAEGIKSALAAGDKALDDAEARYKEAGRLFLIAKTLLGVKSGAASGGLRGSGHTWESWCREQFGLGFGQVALYIRIYQGKQSLEQYKAAKVVRSRARYAKLKAAKDRMETSSTDPKALAIGRIASALWKLDLAQIVAFEDLLP